MFTRWAVRQLEFDAQHGATLWTINHCDFSIWLHCTKPSFHRNSNADCSGITSTLLGLKGSRKFTSAPAVPATHDMWATWRRPEEFSVADSVLSAFFKTEVQLFKQNSQNSIKMSVQWQCSDYGILCNKFFILSSGDGVPFTWKRLDEQYSRMLVIMKLLWDNKEFVALSTSEFVSILLGLSTWNCLLQAKKCNYFGVIFNLSSINILLNCPPNCCLIFKPDRPNEMPLQMTAHFTALCCELQRICMSEFNWRTRYLTSVIILIWQQLQRIVIAPKGLQLTDLCFLHDKWKVKS